jgi:TonB family protein
MRIFGPRLLVALVTFGAGVALGSLWNYARAPLACPRYNAEFETRTNVAVASPPIAEAPAGGSLGKAETSLEQCKLGQFSLDAHELFGGGRNSQGTGMVSGLLQGRALNMPQPRYPSEAKAARIEDVVRVQIVVGEKGDVVTARAVSGHELLRDAAVDAACRSRFFPTKVSDRPVKVAGVITYNFVLQ